MPLIDDLDAGAAKAREARELVRVQYNILPAGTTKEVVERAMALLNEADAILGTEAYTLKRYGDAA